ncbi:hypothetical protein AALP_AA7G040500 [Arabis alpina]|uniref:TF-B3 domain-containing protein n=1 Tax=Arabis alpina TaxID=50452 RepID=A0A087GFT7_ARAAL|nr:hypothetical protein AALP_AA7G040500 [Arabis alpina]
MSSSSRFCLNRECSQSHFKVDHYRSGWPLRTGDFADLCHRCASAYEQGKFCDIFHPRASGWRCCESCGKRIHCGCIVSASAFILLDAGGIECLACTRKKVPLGPSFAPPQSYFLQSPVAEKFRNLTNHISCQPPSLLSPSALQLDLLNLGDRYGFSQPTSHDRGMTDLMGKLMSEKLKNHTIDILNNQKAGPNRNVPPCPNVNVYHPLISLKEGPFGTQIACPAPNTTPIVTTGHSRLDGSNLIFPTAHTPKFSSLSRLPNDLNGGADSTFEKKSWNLGTHFDTPGKYQVVPQYWPKGSNNSQDQQNASKESNFVVTTLFEKMLSASDTRKQGRLVVPKQYAEAYFPQVSDLKGVPLKVQDSMGREWTFRYHLNNTRTYVLDGVAACLQSMQVQAGDTVIFKRLDPERKLIMDFRKASVAQSSDQEIDSVNNISDTCTNEDTEPVDTQSPSKFKKSAKRTKESRSKKKNSNTIITRSKRQKVEKGDLIELKLTCKEAQGLLLPPPNFTPSIVTIEDTEFEEYEDAPIIGKPTVCTSDGGGSTCSEDEELIAEQHDEEAMEETEEHLMSPTATTKHPRHKLGCACIVCLQSPSGFGPKHVQGCCCMVCEMMKRRRRSLLLYNEKKQIDKAENAKKMLESLNFDEELHQCANKSGNTSKNHTSHLKGQIDLNLQPEKDEESMPGAYTTTKNKSVNHDEIVKSSFKPPSSSSPYSHIDKEDTGKLNSETADTNTSSSYPRLVVLLQGE